MNTQPLSIRTFLGSKDFQVSRAFYKMLDFEETVIGPTFSYFQIKDNLGFYLQDYYVKEWINNSMVFLEVEDVETYYQEIMDKDLKAQFSTIKITEIKEEDWGKEFHLIDPSGILWYFGAFRNA